MTISLRDTFATAALSALVTLENSNSFGDDAELSYRYADAMMRARGDDAATSASPGASPDALPDGWYWSGNGAIRKANSHFGAYISGDTVVSHELGVKASAQLDVLAALLRVAGYPVGERVKP